MVALIFSSNSAPSVRRRRADSALWRAIDEPRRDRGAVLEAIRLTPHIEKNLAQEVLGKRRIADKPKKPAVDVGPMPREQSLHRWFAASGDLFNQDLV